MAATTTPVRQSGTGKARAGLLLLLGSESVLFWILVMVYVFLRSSRLQAAAAFAAPQLALPALNTAILLLSAALTGWALHGVRVGNRSALQTGLAAALLLGLIFVGGQVIEFWRSGMAPGDRGAGGIYFTLIGFHAVHVLAGVVFLAINWWRVRLGDFGTHDHVAVEIGTYFWYFVTAVWLVLFAALYLV
jgi:cytochrome c oxidase subunit III